MAKRKRRIKRGKLPKMTDDDLEALAFISPSDIERAKQFGRKNAGILGRAFLNAEKVENADL